MNIHRELLRKMSFTVRPVEHSMVNHNQSDYPRQAFLIGNKNYKCLLEILPTVSQKDNFHCNFEEDYICGRLSHSGRRIRSRYSHSRDYPAKIILNNLVGLMIEVPSRKDSFQLEIPLVLFAGIILKDIPN